MRIVDDVSTSMSLTSLYICNEKKLGLKFTKFYVFLEVQHLYHCIDLQQAQIHAPFDKTCIANGVPGF